MITEEIDEALKDRERWKRASPELKKFALQVAGETLR